MQKTDNPNKPKLSEIVGNFAVECKTDAEKLEFLTILESEGILSFQGRRPTQMLKGSDPCFCLRYRDFGLGYANAFFYESKGIVVKPFAEIMQEYRGYFIGENTRTKRVPFDLEKYKKGAKVVFRGDDYEFRNLLASDLDSDSPLVIRAYRKSCRREIIRQLTYDGLNTPFCKYDYDILLEVPDDSPAVHELKIWPKFYEAVDSGKKRFEIRKDDRNYQVGDMLELRYYYAAQGIYDEKKPVIKAEIIYILNGGQFGLEPGYVAIGFNRIYPQ